MFSRLINSRREKAEESDVGLEDDGVGAEDLRIELCLSDYLREFWNGSNQLIGIEVKE
jgi:hypothetical protein